MQGKCEVCNEETKNNNSCCSDKCYTTRHEYEVSKPQEIKQNED